MEHRAGIEARLLADPALSLPPDLEEELYRITQEALNNALKHARATAISVEIKKQGLELLLSVRDNGRGFEVLGISEQSGLGLRNIEERAAKIGAELALTSNAGAGTVVAVTVMIDEAGEQDWEEDRQRTAVIG